MKHLKLQLLIGLSTSLNMVSMPSFSADDQVQVNSVKHDQNIVITASFTLPLSQCEAYRFLIDHTIQNAIPGIVHANTKRIAPNKVQIERRVEEHVLYIPIHLDSLVEITELPYKGTDFVQITGSAKSYKGTWRLEPKEDGTHFQFNGITDPGTMMPGFLVQHYMNKNLRTSFNELAKIGVSRKGISVEECRS